MPHFATTNAPSVQIMFFTLFAVMAVSVFALAPMLQSAAMRLHFRFDVISLECTVLQ